MISDDGGSDGTEDRAALCVMALGDSAIRFRRPPGVDARALLDALRAWPGVVDAVVTEMHAAVTFDPARPPEAPWRALRASSRAKAPAPQTHTIRVVYDGPDLDDVAHALGIPARDVAARHAAATYTVRMVGFLPGFAYLGPLDPSLVLPRRAEPRRRISAGSVGMAATYTGVYPCASAGGWHLLGRALDFEAFTAEDGATLRLGDEVRFEEAP